MVNEGSLLAEKLALRVFGQMYLSQQIDVLGGKATEKEFYEVSLCKRVISKIIWLEFVHFDSLMYLVLSSNHHLKKQSNIYNQCIRILNNYALMPHTRTYLVENISI